MTNNDADLAAALMAAMNDRAVLKCEVDFGFSLAIDGGFHLRIEQAFTFIDGPSRPIRVDVEGDPTSCAPALTLCRSHTVRSCIVRAGGSLRVDFDRPAAIEVQGGGRYEAWNWCGPNGEKVIAVPDADLAIWRASA